MKESSLSRLSRRVEDHLFGHLLPFWCGPAVDHERGGWMAWLSNDLLSDRTQPKGLVVTSRILWAFSAAYRHRPDKLLRQMADRAFEYLMNRFWDEQHGGAFWQLDDTGRVADDSKKTYGQAFTIYALSEYHLAFGEPDALVWAIELFDLIERHAHDRLHGGYLEVRKRDWSEADTNARLSDKDMNAKKSMNCHLHVLEAYATLYRIWPGQRVKQRLQEVIGLFQCRILDPQTLHLHHFFDEEWRSGSDTYTFGHDIEGTWLLCEAAQLLGDSTLLRRVRTLALQMAEVALKEGIDADGALLYEGKAGKIVDPGRECWPQAEAVIGFLNAFQLSGDPRFFQGSIRVYEFIETHLIDRVHGEWFWRINPDGRPDPTLPKVSAWKGPYHASRMCLETMSRLKSITESLVSDRKTNKVESYGQPTLQP